MKMSLKVMERIINEATAKEIDFLIYAMRFQDNMGVIKGITKDEACRELKIHKSKFYNIIEELERKGVIRVFWNEKRHGFWTLSVIDNCFVEKKSYKKGYINLNTKFLSSDAFLKLTKAEKVICLRILSLYRENRRQIPLKFETLMNWTGMSLQSVIKYAATIKNLFEGTIVSGKIIMIDLKRCYIAFSRGDKSESEIFNKHLIEYIVAAKKVPADGAEIKETLKIFKIMEDKHGKNSVVTAVLRCVDAYNKLIPKYISKMARIVGINKDLTEIFY